MAQSAVETARPDTRTPSPDRVLALGNGYWVAQIVAAAAHYKFFTLIANGRQTVDAIADAAGTDRRGTRIVLDSLVAIQLLEKKDGTFSLTPDADAFLVDGRPRNMAPMLETMSISWDAWGRFQDALKSGNAPVQYSEADAREFFPKLIRNILPLGLGPADATAEHLGIGAAKKGVRILDIGVGGAAWSIPFAKRDRSSTVTGFDVPEVLKETKQIVDSFGVADRYRFVEGDLQKADFGNSQYDIVILGNICHGLTADQNVDLFRRIHRALAADGLLLIADMIPNEERTGPVFPVLFAANMFVMGGADTYPLSMYKDWLKRSGYSDVSTFDTQRSHSPVIIAKR